jgi:hypothetical protein
VWRSRVVHAPWLSSWLSLVSWARIWKSSRKLHNLCPTEISYYTRHSLEDLLRRTTSSSTSLTAEQQVEAGEEPPLHHLKWALRMKACLLIKAPAHVSDPSQCSADSAGFLPFRHAILSIASSSFSRLSLLGYCEEISKLSLV